MRKGPALVRSSFLSVLLNAPGPLAFKWTRNHRPKFGLRTLHCKREPAGTPVHIESLNLSEWVMRHDTQASARPQYSTSRPLNVDHVSFIHAAVNGCYPSTSVRRLHLGFLAFACINTSVVDYTS